MRFHICVAACLAICVASFIPQSFHAHAEDVTSVPLTSGTSLSDALDAAIDKAIVEKRLVGAVVLVSRDGRILYSKAAGYADREAAIPMREDTIFRLASVSKAYTAMAAAALLEQGILRLDAPIAAWLPDFTPSLPNGETPDITVRQLLSHTAGLNYRFFEKADGPYHKADVSDGIGNEGISLRENLRRIASAPLLFEPGTSWQYSVAMDVLGAVIEEATGTGLSQAMRDLVTGPLGLTDTGFAVSDESRLAVPYYNAPSGAPMRMQESDDVDFGGGMIIRFSPGRISDPTAFPAGGAGMAGTAPELMRLLETIRNGGEPVVSPGLMAEMNRVQTADSAVQPGCGFGLGWSVLVDPAEAKTPQAPGTLSWGGVYGHSWFIDPANKLSVVILTNTAPEGMAGQIRTDVRDAVYAHAFQ